MSNPAQFIQPALVAIVCYLTVFIEATDALSGEADKFYVIISSDPQYPFIESNDPRLVGNYEDNKEGLSEDLIKSQYNTMKWLKGILALEDPNAPLRGIIINGDLTNYGHSGELDKMKNLWDTWLPDTHVFMGLGNHDYENNIDDCKGNHCANRMWDFMHQHHQSGLMLAEFSSFPKLFDYTFRLHWQHTNGDGDRDGPLWYAFRLGGRSTIGDDKRLSRVPGVRFIQLQNYLDYEATWNQGRDNEIVIEPDWMWLENQLVASRKYGEPIVLLEHYGGVGTELARMTRQYGVAAHFSGHYHDSLGYQESQTGLKTAEFKTGSAMMGGGMSEEDLGNADGSFLLVKFDLIAEEMTVWRVGNWLGKSYPHRVEEGTYPLFPVKYVESDGIPTWMQRTGKAYQFQSHPLSQGKTIVRNSLDRDIRAVMRCWGCRGAPFWESDAISISPGDTHDFEISIETGWIVHGFGIEHYDPSTSSWESMEDGKDTKEPLFSYIVKERCVNVLYGKREDFTTGNEAQIVRWDADCKYSFENDDPPVFTGQPTSLSVAENSVGGTAVGTVVATDTEGDTLSYSLDAASANVFEIDSTGGDITVKNNAALDHETQASYAATVTASDGPNSTDHSVTISVTDVDEPPAAPGPPTVVGVSRNSVEASWTAPSNVGQPRRRTYDLRYFKGSLDPAFEANWENVRNITDTSRTITGLDADSAYRVQVRAANPEGKSAWSGSGSGSTLVNSAPVFVDQPTSLGVTENHGTFARVGRVTATDADGDTLNYGLDANSTAVFDIGAVENLPKDMITVKNGVTLDHEATSSYSVTVWAVDDWAQTSHEVTINVEDVDEPPAAPGTPTVEGVSRTSVTVSWTAPDMAGKPALTDYDVQYRASEESGWTDASFSGAGTTGTVSGLTPGTTYEAQVRATNDEGTSAWSAAGSGSTDANNAPAFAGQPASLSVPENSAGGTAVGTVAATDADDDTLSYSLDSAAAAVFDIGSAGAITVKDGASLDHEATASYAATVTADDGTDSTDHGVTISVEDLDEPPTAPGTPTVSGVSRASVTVTWTAPDMAGKPAVTEYQVRYRVSGETVWSRASVAGTVTTATVTDLTEGTSYETKVRARNAEGKGPWSAKASGSTHANSAPSFAGQPASLSVPENSAGGTAVGTVAATDADDDELSYSLDDTSAAVFDIGSAGAITVKDGAALDHEATASYAATVTADDGTDSANHVVTINVADVDEPPAAPGTPTVAGASNTSVTVTWTVPDTAGGPAVTDYDVRYRGSAAAGWTDAAFSGAGTETTVSGLAADTLYKAQVRATNAEGTSAWSASGSGSTDANAVPVFAGQPATLKVAENSASGTVVGTVSATDADPGDTLAYSLDAVSAAVFDIDGDGAITVKAKVTLDHESASSYAATVTADDGTATATHDVTINVTDVDEPPDAPGTPTVAGASKTSVTVAWTAPDTAGRPAVTDYDVRYRASGANGWTDASFSGTGTTETITGLTADTAYEAQVRATNAEGTSGWSASGSGSTESLPTVAIAAGGSATEGGTATFAVTVDQAPDADLSVDVSVTQEAGADYLPASPPDSVTIAAGVREATLSVALPDDSVDEPDATVTASIVADSDKYHVGTGSATLTVHDNDLPPLTAEFVGMPAEHNSVRLLRFELRFSEEFETMHNLRARLRDEAFSVTNGTVRGVDRVAPGENRRWRIGVRPDSYKDVTVELPATTDCDAAGAICTSDGRPLSNSSTATVDGPPPLTAEFVGMPAEHDGSQFRFELRFSEEFRGTTGLLARLRDEAFSVTNGSVHEARRVEPGKNRRWRIGVRPNSDEDVTVELPATTDCDAAAAVCTSGGRPLSNSSSATVAGESATNSMAAGLDLLQGPLTVRLSREGDPVQPLALVASRPTMAVAAIRSTGKSAPDVTLRVTTEAAVFDIEADLHATGKQAVAGTGDDTGEMFHSEYLAQVPAELVRPDATFSVLVDPDNALAESDETDNELAVALADLRVVQPPTFKVSLVPVVRRGAEPFAINGHERVLADTLALLPIGAYQTHSAAPLQVDSGASPRQMLDRLHAAWNREADAGEYYHGLYRAGGHPPQGLALLGGRVAVSPVPANGAPDNSGWFVAHGIAHNFGTGDGAPLAAAATYGSATYGWSSATERFFSPFDREVMATPNNGAALFISHAHYERAMAWMSLPTSGRTPAGGIEPTASGGSVALTGGIDASGTWYLYSGERSPKPPREASPGDYTAAVYDEAGMAVLQQPLRIVPLSSSPGGVWALRVPSTIPVRALRIRDRSGDLLLDADLVLEQASPSPNAPP